MPVYNALPFLDQAVESILAQTLRDFRFAIYDDCSTDGSYERALEWAARDPRITVARGTTRLGPCDSSNAAAALATSEFVARMDADDTSMPNRLEVQIKALRDHPDAALVGSTFDMVDVAGRQIRRATPGRILGRAAPFAHSTIMYRKAQFDATGGYQPDTDYFEDLDLYRRLAERGRLLVVNAPLVSLRFAGQNARLRDDRDDVLRKIDRLYRDDPHDGQLDPKVSDMAYYSVAVLSILALERPRMLGAMVRRASFAHPMRATMVLGMIGIAELSPRLARFLGQTASAVRERLLAGRLKPNAVLEWSPTI
jgi:glycosyltransferase involved in cell wall biosynthesis